LDSHAMWFYSESTISALSSVYGAIVMSAATLTAGHAFISLNTVSLKPVPLYFFTIAKVSAIAVFCIHILFFVFYLAIPAEKMVWPDGGHLLFNGLYTMVGSYTATIAGFRVRFVAKRVATSVRSMRQTNTDPLLVAVNRFCCFLIAASIAATFVGAALLNDVSVLVKNGRFALDNPTHYPGPRPVYCGITVVTIFCAWFSWQPIPRRYIRSLFSSKLSLGPSESQATVRSAHPSMARTEHTDASAHSTHLGDETEPQQPADSSGRIPKQERIGSLNSERSSDAIITVISSVSIPEGSESGIPDGSEVERSSIPEGSEGGSMIHGSEVERSSIPEGSEGGSMIHGSQGGPEVCALIVDPVVEAVV